ncbi:DUF3040 domain-containing protein [Pseudonocardia endophytica]|uniref:DUF3040 family protein n=1 Tax=Pseudonocardia endophytica TaxID=401976 RepID=A0A4R1HFT4_PSEEN|nr:DUF3040 domain-containing protein [Pseudonocardia endophytica]TCK20997.1 DUF3040 family protein [Pseudonocardia endophytica]
MKHRERRAFDDLARRLAADDPRLVELLSEKPDPVYRRACRLSNAMGILGVVLVLAGAVLAVDSVLGIGIVVLMSFWLPRHLAHPATRGGQAGEAKPW